MGVALPSCSQLSKTNTDLQLRHESESTWKERWEDWSGEGHHQGQKQKEKRCWKSPGRQLGETMISNDLSPRARDSMYTLIPAQLSSSNQCLFCLTHLASLPKSIQFPVVELEDGYEWGHLNLRSVTEESRLDEFLNTAKLAGTEFTAGTLCRAHNFCI